MKEYTREFKKEAIKLREEKGKIRAAEELGPYELNSAQSGKIFSQYFSGLSGLGIGINTLSRWEKEAGIKRNERESKENEGNREKIGELETKIKEMEKEMGRMRKENEFLEEASRFFAGSRQR